MTVFPQQNNTSIQALDSSRYNLEFEKQLIAEGMEEIKKELLDKWKKAYSGAQIFPESVSELSLELINFLLSFQHTLFYNELSQKYNLSQEQRDLLASVVWNICKNKSWETTETSLQNNLNLSPEISSQIATLINQKILLEARSLANKPSISNTQSNKNTGIIDNVSLVIPEAIKKYPDLGEQLITGNRIKIMNFPEPARPSLKNWLADYVMLTGREDRNAVKRGTYLFQSENGKSLSSAERQRLNYILKCLDENTPVTINKNTKQILFPQISENNYFPTEKSSQPPIEQKNNIQSIQFSYPQKPVSPNYQKMHVAPPVVIPKQEIRSSFGPNVVNLKD